MKKKKVVYQKASIIKRLIAYFIDWYLSSLCMSLAISIVSSFYKSNLIVTSLIAELPLVLAILSLVLGVVFVLVYFLLPSFISAKYTGQSLGKMLMHLRVVHDDDSFVDVKTIVLRVGVGIILLEQAFNSASYTLRSVLSMMIYESFVTNIYYLFLLVSIFSIGFMFFNKDGKMFHDIIAKTKVVESEDESWK
ncbi:MAG: RDD family protein [Traorella sp.]